MKRLLAHRVVRHVLFWLGIWGFFLLIQLPDHFFAGQPLFWRQYLLLQLPTALLTTYSLLYWVLPRLLRYRQVAVFWGLLLAWLVASALVANLMQSFAVFIIAPMITHKPPPEPFQWLKVVDRLSYNFFSVLIISGVAAAIKVLSGWYEQQQLSQQLQQRKLHTELQLLKAQLQPTFLFNTLRTLHTLTTQKSPDSPAAVLHLSALLRYMLYESPLDAVPLTDEVEMMRHYVALEKLRLGSQVEVSLNFSGTLDAHTIAPLLLLPFVENAFRHGTGAQLERPWVSIDLVAKQTSAIFKVINSQPATGGDLSEAAGLSSVRRRLARLYPARFELKVVSEPDTFLISLHLQFAPQPLPLPTTTLVSA